MPKADKAPEILGILPLQDAVLFPNTVIPLAVVKRPGIALVEEALREGKQIGLVALKDKDTEDPGPDDLRRIGTIGTIQKMLKVPDGTLRCIVAGGPVFRDRSVRRARAVPGRDLSPSSPTSRAKAISSSRCSATWARCSRSCSAICRKRRARWRWKSTTSPIPTC
jgi:ATP-dependent Lon protease